MADTIGINSLQQLQKNYQDTDGCLSKTGSIHSGDTSPCIYKFTSSFTLDKPIYINNDDTISIDEGVTISTNTSLTGWEGSGVGSDTDAAIIVKRGKTLTFSGAGTLQSEVMCGIKMTGAGETADGETAKLVVGNGTDDAPVIEGISYGISGNENRHGTEITINSGTVKSSGTGIYQPQEGTLTVNGGKILGTDSGIEIRSGSLEVNGGTIAATGNEEFSVTDNGNGTTTTGAGIAIKQHTTGKAIDVNLKSGDIYGTVAVAYSKTQSTADSAGKVSVNIGETDTNVFTLKSTSNVAVMVGETDSDKGNIGGDDTNELTLKSTSNVVVMVGETDSDKGSVSINKNVALKKIESVTDEGTVTGETTETTPRVIATVLEGQDTSPLLDLKNADDNIKAVVAYLSEEEANAATYNFNVYDNTGSLIGGFSTYESALSSLNTNIATWNIGAVENTRSEGYIRTWYQTIGASSSDSISELRYDLDVTKVTLEVVGASFSVDSIAYGHTNTLREIDASGLSNAVNIEGASNINKITGGAGNDSIYDYGTGDTVVSISGGNGDDYLFGSSIHGNKITGGADADSIVINVGGSIATTITDYKASDGDVVIFGGISGSFDDWTKTARYEIKGEHVELSNNGDVITIQDAKAKDISVTSGSSSGLGLLNFDTEAYQVDTTIFLRGDTKKYTFKDASKNIEVIDGSRARKAVDITNETSLSIEMKGGSFSSSLTGGNGDETLVGGASNDYLKGNGGNDVLTGGDGKDYFIYSSGVDSITDFNSTEDVIELKGNLSVVSGEFSNGNFVIQLSGNSNSIVLEGISAAGDLPISIGEYSISDKYIATKKLLKVNPSVTDLDISNVTQTTIDASGTSGINIYGGSNNNPYYIIGSEYGDTLRGGAGKDYLKGGGGSDIFVISDGNDTVIDYEAGDKISVSGDIPTVFAVNEKYNSITFTLGGTSTALLTSSSDKHKLEVRYAGDGKVPITFVNDSGDQTNNTYVKGAIIDENGNAVVTEAFFDASAVEDVDIKSIDASGLSTGVKLVGNDLGNTLIGGSGSDNLVGGISADSLVGGEGRDLFWYAAGHDTIADFDPSTDTMKFMDPVVPSIKSVSFSGSSNKDLLVEFNDEDSLLIEGVADSLPVKILNSSGKMAYAISNDYIFDGKIVSVMADDNSLVSIPADLSSEFKTKISVEASNVGKNVSIVSEEALALDVSESTDTVGRHYTFNNENGGVIWGGMGNDTLVGGEAEDVFGYRKGSDVFKNFDLENDKIQFLALSGFTDPDLTYLKYGQVITNSTNDNVVTFKTYATEEDKSASSSLKKLLSLKIYTTEAFDTTKEISITDISGEEAYLSSYGLRQEGTMTLSGYTKSFDADAFNAEKRDEDKVTKIDASRVIGKVTIGGTSEMTGNGKTTYVIGGGEYEDPDTFTIDKFIDSDVLQINYRNDYGECAKIQGFDVEDSSANPEDPSKITIHLDNGKDITLNEFVRASGKLTISQPTGTNGAQVASSYKLINDTVDGNLEQALIKDATKRYVTVYSGQFHVGSDGYEKCAYVSVASEDGASIYANSNGNSIIGSEGDDYIVGGNGRDTLYGGDGDDTLVSTGENDILYGGTGNDTFKYSGTGIVQIRDYERGEDILMDEDLENRANIAVFGSTRLKVGDFELGNFVVINCDDGSLPDLIKINGKNYISSGGKYIKDK